MKMKPSYKPNNAKYCKTCRNKNIDKVTKRDKNKKQFTKEDPKYCDSEKYEEQKSKDRERKRMAKERTEEEAAAASMDQSQESTTAPSSTFQTQTSKVSLFKKDR